VTTYVVLTRNGKNEGWTELARVEAAGDLGAIRTAVDGKELAGDFVAVPVRSFHIRRAETRTTVTFVEVTP
jgi:hypothetical protein